MLDSSHMIGQVFGNYRVVNKIGVGGMGAVYEAEHTMMGKPAALKVLLPQFSMRKNIVARFFNEAKAASAIRNAGIVEIYDFGYAPDGSAYILMEFLGGESLQARLERMSILPTDHALHLIRQIARSLLAAHRKGIVHRDLKPDNIFIVPDEEVQGGERTKILDFGIAKLSDDGDSKVKTRTGAVMGTPKYMAPEQCKGAGHVDHRADLYSLGCILFQMLCGRTPFVAEGAGEIMAQHIFVPPPAPSSIQPSIAPELDAFILHLLAKDAARRVSSADEVVGAIDRFLGHGRQDGVRAGTVGLESTRGPATNTGPTGLPDNTTLSAGAVPVSYSTVPPRGGRRFLLPAILAVLLAIGGGAALMLGKDDGSASSQAKASTLVEEEETRGQVGDDARPPTVDGRPEAADDDGTKASAASAKTGNTAGLAAASRTFTVNSRPDGAKVLVDGEAKGNTPAQVEVAEGQTRVVELLHDGYERKRVSLPADADDSGTLIIELEKPDKVALSNEKMSGSDKKESRSKSGKKRRSKNKKKATDTGLKTKIKW